MWVYVKKFIFLPIPLPIAHSPPVPGSKSRDNARINARCRPGAAGFGVGEAKQEVGKLCSWMLRVVLKNQRGATLSVKLSFPILLAHNTSAQSVDDEVEGNAKNDNASYDASLY